MFTRGKSAGSISNDSHLRETASYLGWVWSGPIYTLWWVENKRSKVNTSLESQKKWQYTVYTRAHGAKPNAASARICGLGRVCHLCCGLGGNLSRHSSVQRGQGTASSFPAKYNYSLKKCLPELIKRRKGSEWSKQRRTGCKTSVKLPISLRGKSRQRSRFRSSVSESLRFTDTRRSELHPAACRTRSVQEQEQDTFKGVAGVWPGHRPQQMNVWTCSHLSFRPSSDRCKHVTTWLFYVWLKWILGLNKSISTSKCVMCANHDCLF